nr:MFS transporter [Sphaerisporangium album]
MAMADTIAATLAIPVLQSPHGLPGTPVSALTWLITAYALPVATGLTTAGRLADLAGPRLVLIAGLAVFTFGAAVTCLAPNLGWLLAARATQGLGAAAMIPASLALILVTLPASRTAAIGLWNAASGIGAAAMHAGGGWLADLLSWRALWLPQAVIGMTLLLGVTGLPTATSTSSASNATRWHRPDLAGLALLATVFLTATYALSQASRLPTAILVAALAASGLGLLATAWRSRHHPTPAIETGVYARPAFALAALVALLHGAMSIAMLTAIPMYLQHTLHRTPTGYGLAMAPMSIAMALTSIAVGRAGKHLRPGWMIYIGSVAVVACYLWVATALGPVPHLSAIWIPASIPLGAGMGAIATSLSAAATLSAGAGRYAAATGAVMTGRQLGGAFGLAGMAAVLQHPVLTGPAAGYTSVILGCLACAGLAGFCGLLLVRRAEPAATHPARSRPAQGPRSTGSVTAIPAFTQTPPPHPRAQTPAIPASSATSSAAARRALPDLTG